MTPLWNNHSNGMLGLAVFFFAFAGFCARENSVNSPQQHPFLRWLSARFLAAGRCRVALRGTGAGFGGLLSCPVGSVGRDFGTAGRFSGTAGWFSDAPISFSGTLERFSGTAESVSATVGSFSGTAGWFFGTAGRFSDAPISFSGTEKSFCGTGKPFFHAVSPDFALF
jgi:hypothetical protein